jgi:uncharacterized protein
MQFLAIIVLVLSAVVQPQAQNQRVHDFAGLLSAEQRQELEQTAEDVEHKTTAQFAIVTVNSLDGKTIEEYANELFKSWGIGKQGMNNGVLFLIAPNERRMKFEVGDGLDPLLTDALCGQIADDHIVPRFKQNDYAGGIVAGTKQVAAVLSGNPAAARGIANSGPVLRRDAVRHSMIATSCVAIAAVVVGVLGLIAKSRRLYSTTMFATVTAVIFVLIAVAAFLVWRTPARQQPLGWFGGATFASLAAWALNFARYRRFGPHGCSKCGAHLELLSEQDDDPKLSSVQQLEEKIGSVDYDVWICPACLNNDTERYINAFSSFQECPKCNARTFKEDAQRTLVPATTLSSGMAEVEGRCVSCNYKRIRKIVLPQIPTTTTSSGSSGGSSFGSGGGWSGGGSFGGGGGGGGVGGFGGGTSSGGGASRGW